MDVSPVQQMIWHDIWNILGCALLNLHIWTNFVNAEIHLPVVETLESLTTSPLLGLLCGMLYLHGGFYAWCDLGCNRTCGGIRNILQNSSWSVWILIRNMPHYMHWLINYLTWPQFLCLLGFGIVYHSIHIYSNICFFIFIHISIYLLLHFLFL